MHRFLNIFLQLAAEKKYSKNGAAGNFLGPSYFVKALENAKERIMAKSAIVLTVFLICPYTDVEQKAFMNSVIV